MKSEVRSPRCEVELLTSTSDFALRTSHFALQTSHFALRTSHFGLRTSSWEVIQALGAFSAAGGAAPPSQLRELVSAVAP